MKDPEIFYADDDIDDIDIFEDAVKNIEERDSKKIVLNLHSSGEDMLKNLLQLKAKNPVIFLDINMPKKNGFEVLEILRKHEKFKKVPVVMFSTSSDEKNIRKAHNLGANLYAVKPSNFADLKSIIDKVISINWGEFHANLKNFVIAA